MSLKTLTVVLDQKRQSSAKERVSETVMGWLDLVVGVMGSELESGIQSRVGARPK